VIAYLLRTLRLGFKSLLLHKLRTGLAMLGILIGVTAVIWLVALGEGVSYQAQKQIEDLGATNIIIKSVKPPSGGQTGGRGSTRVIAYGLTRGDYYKMLELVPEIQRATPMREIATMAWYGGRQTDVRILGVTPAYQEINHLDMDVGRFIEQADLERSENICVLGSEVANELFGYEEPIGRAVQLHFNFTSALFTVVGITKSRNPSAAIGGSLEGRDYNTDVYIPLETFRQRIGDQVITSRSGTTEGELIELSQVTATVASIGEVEGAADTIRDLLGRTHKTNDISVIVPKELLRQAEMLRMLFNVLLVLIAGISLLVGGIGIMNIMLATVTERTREIGIRRALGATRTDIVYQFLAESISLTAIGGLIGVACGFLCLPATKGLLYVLKSGLPDVWAVLPATIHNLSPIITPMSVGASFLTSLVVGVSFGLYPAYRAALMDPIEALRHE
jgi:putative ABC transport system permease protein